MKPLGDGLSKMIKMIIAPIIFCTVVIGIAGMEDMKKVGKTGGLAFLYFEVASTIVLIIGLILVNVLKPGEGMNINPATLDTKAIAAYTGPGKMTGSVDFILNIIPTTIVDGFALHRFGGSGFIVLAATLSAVGTVPVAGLALILGIDRFMSEARALTNLIGNGVATIVVAKWTGDLDTKRLDAALNNES